MRRTREIEDGDGEYLRVGAARELADVAVVGGGVEPGRRRAARVVRPRRGRGVGGGRGREEASGVAADAHGGGGRGAGLS
jgi:hypothetical protein